MTSPPASSAAGPEPASVRRTVTPSRALAWRDGTAIERPERLATEEPMEIRAGGPGQEPVSVAVTMRTPGHDFDLAVGFLVGEGLIRARDEVADGAVLRPAARRAAALQHRHRGADPPVRAGRRRAPVLHHVELRHLRQGVARPGRGALRRDPGRAAGAGVGGGRRCPTASARPSGSSSRPAASTPPGCSSGPARSSPSGRTSGATTPSTSSSAERCWPANFPCPTR